MNIAGFWHYHGPVDDDGASVTGDFCSAICIQGSAKGSRYHGPVIKNNFHGNGVLVSADGSVFHGNWKNDVRHGPGIEAYANGVISKHEGEYPGDEMHGKGVMTYKNGDKFEGRWKKGHKFFGFHTDAKGTITPRVFDSEGVLLPSSTQGKESRSPNTEKNKTRKICEICKMKTCMMTTFKIRIFTNIRCVVLILMRICSLF